jgi:cold shock protein
VSTLSGVVKVFTQKSYGFIQRDDGGKDVFVHSSAVENGLKLAAGDRVTFEVVPADRGPRANNVRLAD